MTIGLARPTRLTKLGVPDRRGTNPVSLANLKPPYKPGENGHGRVYPLKERLRHALDHPLKEPNPDAPAGERIVYATLKGAINCEPTFAHLREVWDRVEGKVPGDQPPAVNQDNRVLNIYVMDEKTKDLIAQVKDRARKLIVGEPPP